MDGSFVPDNDTSCSVFCNGYDNLTVDSRVIQNYEDENRVPTPPFYYYFGGIYLNNSSGSTVIGCTFKDLEGSGLDVTDCSQFTLTECYFDRIGWEMGGPDSWNYYYGYQASGNGIFLGWTQDFTISYNDFDSVAQSAVLTWDISPYPDRNGVIDNNIMRECGDQYITGTDYGSAVSIVEMGGIDITNNLMYDNYDLPAIGFRNPQYNMTISNNKIMDNPGGIYLSFSGSVVGTFSPATWTVTDNYIFQNTYGMAHNASPGGAFTMIIENNWWGSNSGPYSDATGANTNTTGRGNAVNELAGYNLDFSPWMVNSGTTYCNSTYTRFGVNDGHTWGFDCKDNVPECVDIAQSRLPGT